MITTLPSRAQCAALFAEYHSTRTTESRNKIVTAYLPHVEHLAIKLHRTLPVHVLLDDLISWGVIGLMQSIEKFDPAKGPLFQSFAAMRVRGAMIDELREYEPTPRDLLEKNKLLAEAREHLTQQLMRPPTPFEVWERAGFSPNSFSESERSARTVNGGTLLFENGDEKRCRPLIDQSPMCIAEKIEVDEMIHYVLKHYGVSAALLLRCVYVEGHPLKTAGEWLGVSGGMISQTHKLILNALKGRFAA